MSRRGIALNALRDHTIGLMGARVSIRSLHRPTWRIALICGFARLLFLPALAITPEDADALFAAHAKAFYREKDEHGWFAESTDGGKASFWMRAEQMEMVLDAFERTKKPEQLAMFTRLFHGFIADHGATWERNDFNDDLIWMVIACVRANLLSGERPFLDAAKTNFDLCYARASSPDLGGGLWWKTDNRSKNACVNGPAAIAAFLLSKATGDEAYRAKAKDIFLWERATLFDPVSGRVADNINVDGRVGRRPFTYNQGTFVGAAHFLGYPEDAKLAAEFTMTRMSRDGYFPPSAENGDGGGFNGIAARWITRFMRERGEQSTFEPWLQKNAEAAWNARRMSDGLSWSRWPEPTTEGRRYSWGCSSAVVLLQVMAGK
jgi:predicted alpha-1,6-mannanase (GH76 family)